MGSRSVCQPLKAKFTTPLHIDDWPERVLDSCAWIPHSGQLGTDRLTSEVMSLTTDMMDQSHIGRQSELKRQGRVDRADRTDCCRAIAKQTSRRVTLKDQGVAELRSSVIRVNGKNTSPARCRRKTGEKEIGAVGWRGGRAGDYIEPHTGRHKDKER
jgi:hypothetical protein